MAAARSHAMRVGQKTRHDSAGATSHTSVQRWSSFAAEPRPGRPVSGSLGPGRVPHPFGFAINTAGGLERARADGVHAKEAVADFDLLREGHRTEVALVHVGIQKLAKNLSPPAVSGVSASAKMRTELAKKNQDKKRSTWAQTSMLLMVALMATMSTGVRKYSSYQTETRQAGRRRPTCGQQKEDSPTHLGKHLFQPNTACRAHHVDLVDLKRHEWMVNRAPVVAPRTTRRPSLRRSGGSSSMLLISMAPFSMVQMRMVGMRRDKAGMRPLPPE